uniref:SPARC n=2 Tax=Bos TaxID=9903 RepID=A0A8B9WZK9_BOSMU
MIPPAFPVPALCSVSLSRQELQNPCGGRGWEAGQDSPPRGEEERLGRQRQLWLWGEGEGRGGEGGDTGGGGTTGWRGRQTQPRALSGFLLPGSKPLTFLQTSRLPGACLLPACLPLRVPSTMRAWIFFLLCLAGRALAAPQQEALPDETEVVEETVAEVAEVPVGANPVQVEVGEFDDGAEETEEEVVAENPCQNHHCKHGKVCELDENNTPMCVCQDPTSCPAPIGEFEKVCSNDNKTFDSSCHFFATKCTLEGTKKGHKLHLDYIGPCKYIPPCLDSELTEFPLRMRDWLKNVLVTLYERDEDNNLLTEKQKLRVKKIHENEKRLEAGDHPVELLARDFEKNYNMYIFPVHWQFGQLDQHPIDGYLSHTELAPLRAPLIPMEHCTTRFFETCDLDNDKYIALDEWAGCFGIKEKDIDKDLVI